MGVLELAFITVHLSVAKATENCTSAHDAAQLHAHAHRLAYCKTTMGMRASLRSIMPLSPIFADTTPSLAHVNCTFRHDKALQSESVTDVLQTQRLLLTPCQLVGRPARLLRALKAPAESALIAAASL